MFKQPHDDHRNKIYKTPEAKALIGIVRKQTRPQAEEELSKKDGVKPTKEELDEFLDFFIKSLIKNGTMKEMIDSYLDQKIKDQQKRDGRPQSDTFRFKSVFSYKNAQRNFESAEEPCLSMQTEKFHKQ
jgi:hypothetical protein